MVRTIINSLKIITVVGSILLLNCITDLDPSISKNMKVDDIPLDVKPNKQLPILGKESSGIDASTPNRNWSNNDSTFTNQLILIDTTCTIKKP
jgi:hypothetical protein